MTRADVVSASRRETRADRRAVRRVVLHWRDGHGHAYQVEDGSSTYRFRIGAGKLGSTIVYTIRGQAGNGCILGGAGDDSLRGDGGTDVCIGGPGTDRFHSSCETQIQ